MRRVMVTDGTVGDTMFVPGDTVRTYLSGGALTMTNPTHPDQPAPAHEDVSTSEGLRALLIRLHRAGPGAWQDDPAAAELMGLAADKYAGLARKHGLDPWVAASAAFDVMRTRAAREATDPWALITHAVRITCIAEQRAQGLLCSVHQARRPHISAFHDAERFSERDNQLTDYHPAFQVTETFIDADVHEADDSVTERPSMSAGCAVEESIALFTLLGWPPDTARAAIEHVCGTLTETGTRHATFEALRRDSHARALLDLPRRSWSALLKALLGNPDPALSATKLGRGVLLRLLIGEDLASLLHDDDLVLAISLTAPSAQAHRRAGGERS